MSVDDPATPTLAELRRTRSRQEMALRWLRPAGLAIALLVVARAFRGSPPPGLHGAGLGISATLVAIAAGGTGVLTTARASMPLQMTFFTLFLAGSAALFWLQPGGAGLVGALVAVGLMTRWLPVRLTIGPVGLTLVLVAVSAAADDRHHAASAVLLSEVALVAVYGVGLLTRRIGQGNVQTERLLAELEQVRGAEVRAAAMTERQRLAREMHDVLAHSLSGLALQLEGARLLVAGDPSDPRLGLVIDRAHHLATAGVQEARWAIGMLRGDQFPGPERLAALIAEFERDSGIPSRLEVTGDQGELNPSAQLALYRVTQEALTNIRKHARPDRVEVALNYRPGGTGLRVEDFAAPPRPVAAEAPAADDAGYGLTGMRERAELLDGRLCAVATGDGFRVTMWIPG